MGPPPAVTFLLMTYNQQAFVREAVRAALAQDYAPLTIAISDDASSDASYAIAQEEVARYRGPHTVILRRNPVRRGSVDHLAAVVAAIGGDLIVTAHGDDISLPQRTRHVVAAWQAQNASLVTSNAIFIDEHGNRGTQTCATATPRPVTAEEMIEGAWQWELLGATLAFEPQVLSAFRPLSSRALAFGLDHVLPLRAALLKGVHYLAEPLVLYRRHANSMTRGIADGSDADAAYHEIHLAYEMMTRMHGLDDIGDLAEARPDDRTLRRLETRLAERLIHDMRWLTRLRARLYAQGMKPKWVGTEAP